MNRTIAKPSQARFQLPFAIPAQRDYATVLGRKTSSYGGVSVSTDSLQIGRHVEDDSLASLIIGSHK